ISVTVFTSVALGGLLVRGGNVSLEGRHQQYGAFLLLPFVFDGIVEGIRRTRGWRLQLAGLCAVAFLLFPAAYGVLVPGDRLVRKLPKDRSSFGSQGVAIWRADEGKGPAALTRELESYPPFRDALLVTSEPTLALQFPEKRVVIVLHDDDWKAHRRYGR